MLVLIEHNCGQWKIYKLWTTYGQFFDNLWTMRDIQINLGIATEIKIYKAFDIPSDLLILSSDDPFASIVENIHISETSRKDEWYNMFPK